jgi:FkbM family methyltransferase
MKNLTVLKDNKWLWPISDENSWEGQNTYTDLYKHILPYVSDQNIMIQAGGNCGFILSTFVPHFKHVYTFEPDPVNFYCLTHNVPDDHVYKMQACLGDKHETVSVQQLIRPDRLHDTGGVHVSGTGYTPTIIIDNLNLPGCDLIQLDIEGYELNALNGAIETIKKYKPVLCIEFCEKWLNRYNANSDKILNLLEELNYVLVEEFGVDKIFQSKSYAK